MAGVVSYQDANGNPIVVTPLTPLPVTGLVAAAAPSTFATVLTDVALTADGIIWQLQGSATKVVMITNVVFSMNLTAASMFNFFLTRFSTAAAGGTIIASARGRFDTTGGGGSAVQTIWTVPPAPGVGIADLYGARGLAPTPTTLDTVLDKTFGTANDQAITLRGVGEFLCGRISGVAAYAGALADINIRWTEQ